MNNIPETPARPSYRIIPDGPQTILINDHSSLHRIVLPERIRTRQGVTPGSYRG
jgi:hypothetical protein